MKETVKIELPRALAMRAYLHFKDDYEVDKRVLEITDDGKCPPEHGLYEEDFNELGKAIEQLKRVLEL